MREEVSAFWAPVIPYPGEGGAGQGTRAEPKEWTCRFSIQPFASDHQALYTLRHTRRRCVYLHSAVSEQGSKLLGTFSTTRIMIRTRGPTRDDAKPRSRRLGQ